MSTYIFALYVYGDIHEGFGVITLNPSFISISIKTILGAFELKTGKANLILSLGVPYLLFKAEGGI